MPKPTDARLTLAEMCTDPATEVLDAIRSFGGRKKIFMVHFRNIKGGYLHFDEVYPDSGAVDPEKERQFAFCLGYIKALLQVVEREA